MLVLSVKCVVRKEMLADYACNKFSDLCVKRFAQMISNDCHMIELYFEIILFANCMDSLGFIRKAHYTSTVSVNRIGKSSRSASMA